MGKEHRKTPRIRTTNKALEGKQFSTVRLPKKNEIKQTTLPLEMRSGLQAQQQLLIQQRQQQAAKASRQQHGEGDIDKNTVKDFDPIINDGTFLIVDREESCWPPPALSSVIAEHTAVAEGSENYVSKDALDLYDRSKNTQYNSYNQRSLDAAMEIAQEHSSKAGHSGAGDDNAQGFFGHRSLLTGNASSATATVTKGKSGGRSVGVANDHPNAGYNPRSDAVGMAALVPGAVKMTQRSIAGKLKTVDGPFFNKPRVAGEVNLPKGKVRTNSKMTFDGSDSD